MATTNANRFLGVASKALGSPRYSYLGRTLFRVCMQATELALGLLGSKATYYMQARASIAQFLPPQLWGSLLSLAMLPRQLKVHAVQVGLISVHISALSAYIDGYI